MSISISTRGYQGGTIQFFGPSGIVGITSGMLERWTPVVARVSLGAGSLMWIVVMSGRRDEMIFYPNRPLIHSERGDQRFIPMYRDRSSVIVEDDGRQLVTVLPNGGWWREHFKMLFVAGSEMIHEESEA